MSESSYRDLVAWQRAMELVTSVYRRTDDFPQREIYGLTNQIRRSAVSVASNIAEGKGRRSKKEYVQFLCRARGSLFELETQLEIAKNLEYLTESEYGSLREQAAAAARPLNGLITSVERQLTSPDSRQPTADSQ